MAAVTGTKGSITIPDNTIILDSTGVPLITRWQCTFTRDVIDISNFDSQTNDSEFIGGLMDAKGSFEGWIDDIATAPTLTDISNPDSVGTANWLLSLVATTKRYEFTALVSNFSISHDKASGGVPFSCSFESSGLITVTDA